MNNLANSYDAAGRQDEALKLREEVLTLRKRCSARKIQTRSMRWTTWQMLTLPSVVTRKR